MTRKQWIVLGAIAALIVVPVGLKLARKDAGKMVDIEQVSLRALAPTVLASGSLTYESQVTLAPEVTGRVTEILVEEGDQVKREQLLMRLDPRAPRAAIEQSEAQVRQARLSIERRQVDFDTLVARTKRFEALRAQGMVDINSLEELVSARNLAEVDLRTSREQLSQALAQLRQAQEQLAKTEIRSPLDGKVTAIYVKVGQTAVPSFSGIAGSILIDVADTASIDAEIHVDETDIARVRVGAQARVVPAAFPDKTLTGTVDQVAIAPRQQPGQNKSYPVRIRLTNTQGVTFHPGMSCRAEVLTGSLVDEKVLAVPVQALRYEDNPDKSSKSEKSIASVFIFDGGRAIKRAVSTGTADDTYIAVTTGLKEGDQVVVGPAKTLLFLLDGEKVGLNVKAELAAKK
ncbi:MAG: efflux transporter periplasmic adaptor subunit [Steroidobacteraceae bacterium]|jgi:HlyD family secretion protein|nr:efflux transporter periplasmic adaptor subunit [Steroidobacteraceae bacterium]